MDSARRENAIPAISSVLTLNIHISVFVGFLSVFVSFLSVFLSFCQFLSVFSVFEFHSNGQPSVAIT